MNFLGIVKAELSKVKCEKVCLVIKTLNEVFQELLSLCMFLLVSSYPNYTYKLINLNIKNIFICFLYLIILGWIFL